MTEATERYRRRESNEKWRLLFVVCAVFVGVVGLGGFGTLIVSTHNIAQHVQNAQTNHAETLAELSDLTTQNHALLKALQTDETTSLTELHGIESLERFVAAVQASSAKKNPDVVLIENELHVICAELGHPGCSP